MTRQIGDLLGDMVDQPRRMEFCLSTPLTDNLMARLLGSET